MPEGSNPDNMIVDIEEGCIVNDKLTRIATMKVAELEDELKKRKLKTSDNKKVLQDRLKAFIDLETEHGEDEENDREEDEEEERRVRCTLNSRQQERAYDNIRGCGRVHEHIQW
jgi:AMMECR1 domain-containing protein